MRLADQDRRSHLTLGIRFQTRSPHLGFPPPRSHNLFHRRLLGDKSLDRQPPPRVQLPFHTSDLHLTGFDHEKLTFAYAGMDQRLTSVRGEMIEEVMA